MNVRQIRGIGRAAGLVAVLWAAGASAAPRPTPANLLIDAQEWSLWPSRASVPAGTVDVELWNRGQDPHDARIRRLNASGHMVGSVVGQVRATRPGQISRATWHLTAGRYELYCGLAGHRELGMHARLLVTPTRPARRRSRTR